MVGEIGMKDRSGRDERKERQGWKTGEAEMEDRRTLDGRQGRSG